MGFVPHLYTLAITIAYLLLAALFYPSVRVMSECKDTGSLSGWAKHPEMLSESYHDNHHANLPHEADSGNTDISAQYESLKPNENEKYQKIPVSILADREVFEYLKEKGDERKTRTEAYCDLLDKSLAGFVSPFFKKEGLRAATTSAT